MAAHMQASVLTASTVGVPFPDETIDGSEGSYGSESQRAKDK
ncbi:hypothetical protein SLEP1_g15189 [Rubroshorea leprosula]|uniref:Uncharacterized protein n=1 Tax=Rubroshorea leprosula TaxID=152421 RepID=A0AAV5IXB9_9ROSI|nr:hypothetical protein SLEP1_g15189 [Rubroshorea leprosula]